MIFDSFKNKFQLRFKNREIAASILEGALEDSLKKIKIVDKKEYNLIVMGIPRGGVVVADIVASKLKSSSYSQAEFDIIIPRKIAAPGNQEIAIGAIIGQEDDNGNGNDSDKKATTTTTYLNDELIKELEMSQEYIEKEKTRQLKEIKRRQSLYRHNLKKEYYIEDKVVILVDDGAATGATLIAAARWIKKNKEKPKKLIIAIPVASKDIVVKLKKECDVVVTGTTVSSTYTFKSVGQFYQEFKPVEDDKVIEICKRNKLVVTD
jgi:putative phosphoribosyl transferase